VQPEEKRARSNSQQFSNQTGPAQLEAHTSSITVIASTVEDPNRFISKTQSSNSVHDSVMIITGASAGDMIVWKFNAESNQMTKEKHFHDHDRAITSIFVHQEMQCFISSSSDGSCNLYNQFKLQLIRVYQHPNLSPVSSVVLSVQPLPCAAMFSVSDHTWTSFSINGTNLTGMEESKSNFHEESNQITAPKVI
jgi:WD40 repeat protein